MIEMCAGRPVGGLLGAESRARGTLEAQSPPRLPSSLLLWAAAGPGRASGQRVEGRGGRQWRVSLLNWKRQRETRLRHNVPSDRRPSHSSPVLSSCYGDGSARTISRQVGNCNIFSFSSVEYFFRSSRLLYETTLGAHGLSMVTSLTLARQMIVRLETLAACGIVHGDIQPGNWLMGKDGKARIVLFLAPATVLFPVSIRLVPSTHHPM